MKEHPFPPVVRWALFPALAAVAGAAAGVLGAELTEPFRRMDWAAIAGGLASASALAFAVSTRAWIVALAAPPLGTLMGSAALALAAGLSGIQGVPAAGAWAVLKQLVREPGSLFLISLSSLAYAGAFAAAGRTWLRNAAAFGIFAVVAGSLSCAMTTSWGLTTALAIAAQIAPYRAALAVSERLRRNVALYTE